jgi:hypothetical protein
MATLNKGGSYGTTAVAEEVLAGSTVQVTYVPVGSANAPLTENAAAQEVSIALNPGGSDPAVPGTVLFGWMGHDYSDNGQGLLFRGAGPSTPGVQSGVMNYATCTAILDDWVVGPNPQTITLKRLWTRRQRWTTGVIFGRTATAPIKAGAGGMTLTATDMAGGALTATVNGQGEISGDDVVGAIDFATGAYQVMFGALVLDSSLSAAEKAEWWYSAADVGAVEAGRIWRPVAVDPTSIRYSAVTFTVLPIDSELMGLTPERLRPDGLAPFARPGDYAYVSVTITGSAFTPAVGQTYNVGSTLLSGIDILDAGPNGGRVSTGYTEDLDAGTLTINDTTGWPAQVIVRGRASVYRRVASVAVNGDVTFTMPIGRTFPVGAVFSTALRFGNRQAFVERAFDQQNWDGFTWSETLTGNSALFSYNFTAFPVELNNRGAVSEWFALRFRNDATTFDLIGRSLGQIASGTVNADFSPVNAQADNAPYFTLRSGGWGSGQVPGNVLFIHIRGAEMSFGMLRSISPGSAAGIDYSALLELNGDIDRPPSDPFA